MSFQTELEKILQDQLQWATKAETDRCIEIVRNCLIKNPEVKQFDFAWNDAINFALKMLECWKERFNEICVSSSSEPSPQPSNPDKTRPKLG